MICILLLLLQQQQLLQQLLLLLLLLLLLRLPCCMLWPVQRVSPLCAGSALSDALLLNFVLLGAVDLPGSAVAAYAIEAVGAQRTAVAFLGMAGATLLALAALQSAILSGGAVDASDASAYASAAVAMALLGKSLASGSFTAVFLLTTDRHPTKLRTAAVGCGMCFGKIGAASAPPLSTLMPLPTFFALVAGLLAAAAAAAATLPVDPDER